jgi:hypothetical protein
MKTKHCHLIGLSTLIVIGFSLSAQAADRVRAGQWVGTTMAGGKTYPTSSCVSQSDAAGMNGDAKTVKAYLETIIPPQICKITDVKADGNQVIYTASCTAGTAKTVKTVTTSYYGDRSEGTDSTGSKMEAKLVSHRSETDPRDMKRGRVSRGVGTEVGCALVLTARKLV